MKAILFITLAVVAIAFIVALAMWALIASSHIHGTIDASNRSLILSNPSASAKQVKIFVQLTNGSSITLPLREIPAGSTPIKFDDLGLPNTTAPSDLNALIVEARHWYGTATNTSTLRLK